SVNRTTGKSPFKVVYGRNPITPLDLVPVSNVGQFKELHRSVQELIIRHNKQYKEHANKRRFGKLKPRGNGPFCVLKKINDNAYTIELPGHYNVSATFNVADLLSYKGDSDDEPDSRSSLFQEGEDDADAVNEKKAEAELAHPAHDPRDVETIERLHQRIQELKLRQLQQDSQTEEAEFEYRDRRYHLRRTDRAVDRDDRYHNDPIRNMGLKIEDPEFYRYGFIRIDFILWCWLSTVERVFDVRDIPDKLKVKLVAIKLRQHASLWWDHVNKRRRIEGKSKVETWEKMKKLMKAKFLPENHRQEAFLDYHNLSQQNMTVEEVINEFDKLRMRCDVVEEEEQVVARFLGVLKPEIADIVSLQPYWTYTDVCRLALKVEKQIKAKSKGSTSRFTPPTRTTPPTEPKITTPTTMDAGNASERVNNAPRCYKCSGIRNYARDCLNLKTLAFVPDDTCPIYDTDAEPELDEPGDKLVYPDRGEALVIQIVLNVVVSKSVDDNSWLRNNIFRTKYTSKGKFFDMIIDGGGCENVISTYMVEKLEIKIKDHPEPY
ncbi:reverse transcriptase domain-containing protein, partial [Tanacetum coccineum]